MYMLYTYTARDLFQHQHIHVPVLKATCYNRTFDHDYVVYVSLLLI